VLYSLTERVEDNSEGREQVSAHAYLYEYIQVGYPSKVSRILALSVSPRNVYPTTATGKYIISKAATDIMVLRLVCHYAKCATTYVITN